MSLRRQLLVVSLLLLSLPWAGCQYLREMETTLRAGQGMAAAATAQALAAALGERPDLVYPVAARRLERAARQEWYLERATRPLITDGFDDDWREQPQLRALPTAPPGVALFAASRGERLFLLLRVDDSTPRYRRPGRSAAVNGDRLVMRCIDSLGAGNTLVIAPEGPGFVRAQTLAAGAARLADRVRGAWRERDGGYTLELQMPLDAQCERLSLRLVDAQPQGESVRFDSRDAFAGDAPWLVYRVPALDAWLGAFEQPGRRITVRDRSGHEVGEVATAAAEVPPAEVFWLLRLLYRAILRGDDAPREGSDAAAASAGWQAVAGPDGGIELHAAAPIGDGAAALGSLRVSESTERYLALTDRASSRVFAVSASVLALAFGGLFAYATLLSLRIRRLSAAATRIAAQEQAADSFPRSRAGDELGELSRRYAALLEQISDYNLYLRGLARTLSHELRTPIAVVGSSLENLGRAEAGEREAYLLRAREGLSRLNRIVTAMSEASRIEESLQALHLEEVELNSLLAELRSAYASTFPAHTLAFAAAAEPVPVRASGDLLAQALDKLAENAASFAPAGSTIRLAVRREGEDAVITVSNTGPLLPQQLRERLFEPMVSLREGRSGDGTHLGLGLHVARAIATAHGGQLEAADLPDGDGVVFCLRLPLAERSGAAATS